MSASAQATPNPPQQDLGANQFTLQDSGGSTQITFYPIAPGPLLSGTPEGGSRLEYKGEEGSFLFSGDQVQSQDGPIGHLISVNLQTPPGARPLIFTLVLPSVSAVSGDATQSFKTIAIKTWGRASVPPVGPRGTYAGPDRTYAVVELDGVAATVAMPM